MLGMGPLGAAPMGAAPYRSPFNYTVPASETKEGQERLRAYYEALGRFIDIFTRVETAITLTLWAYAKTKPNIAKVIFAGTKIDVGSSYIKQLAEMTGASQDARNDLNNVLQQLGIINGVRNSILHYGAGSVAEGNAIVSNELKAKGNPIVFPISPTALNHMALDLRKITIHLYYRHLGRPQPLGILGRATLDDVLHSPWLYKYPSPPKRQSKKGEDPPSQKRRLKPIRPPESSQE
jgi:hypothetical protein